MIDRREILDNARDLGLEARFVKKDYVLGWLLAVSRDSTRQQRTELSEKVQDLYLNSSQISGRIRGSDKVVLRPRQEDLDATDGLPRIEGDFKWRSPHHALSRGPAGSPTSGQAANDEPPTPEQSREYEASICGDLN